MSYPTIHSDVLSGPRAVDAAPDTGALARLPADHDYIMAARVQGDTGCVKKKLASMPSENNQVSVRPVAPYIGGKRNLAKRVCAIIDSHEHTAYAEPFIGMGGIFLRRNQRAKAEFINDLNGDVYTLFRVLQEHYVAFLDLLRFQITTQSNYERLVSIDPATLTDLQRAARFLYLQRCAFGGKVSGRSFGLSADRSARFNLTTLEPDLEALHERLSGVTVTCLDFGAFIDRVDRPGTLFYLDPPYWGCESDYGKGAFDRGRFAELSEQLRGIRGDFLLSINDVPEIRELFGWAQIRSVETTYSVASGAAKKAGELLISSWET